MQLESVKIYPFNEECLIIDFGNLISEQINSRVLKIAHLFESDPFPGMIEVCPTYSSVAIFYDSLSVKRNFQNFETAYEAVKDLAEKALSKANQVENPQEGVIQIPVSFDNSPDLDFIASRSNLSCEKVIEIFLSKTYRVYMLGFLPGFAYMGDVPEEIATPRREVPRKRVEKGSIGIAGRQTGIYPIESPGGWQIIGKTNFEVLDMSNSENPIRLRPGDLVRFFRV